MPSLSRCRVSLQNWLEQRFSLSIAKTRHGTREWAEIRQLGIPIECIFDVGANVGQTAKRLHEDFPNARIYCFEPVASTFTTLTKNLNGHSYATLHKFALSRENGVASVFVQGENSLTSTLVETNKYQHVEEIETRTLDSLVEEMKLGSIDLLKIDAEGHDLAVLQGGTQALSGGRIKVIYCEVGFLRGDVHHGDFYSIVDFLTALGYAMYGIYSQALTDSVPRKLFFANVTFVHVNNYSNGH